MRHVLSGLAGFFVAPLALVLYGIGSYQSRLAMMQTFSGLDAAPWLLLVLAAGVLIGLVAMLRTSPVGPLVAGGFYLLLLLINILSPRLMFQALHFVFGGASRGSFWGRMSFAIQDPIYSGAVGFVGAALVVAAFSAQRWRTWPSGPGAAPAPPGPYGSPPFGGPPPSGEPAPFGG
ncbi:MAG: hypothetical protein ACRDTM_15385, partial [Micromonosporaceae bacterium]